MSIKSKLSAEQMSVIVQELESGRSAQELARANGISDKTIYTWRKKFKGMKSEDIRKLKFFENENARLKRIIANLTIDIDALREINAKSGKPTSKT